MAFNELNLSLQEKLKLTLWQTHIDIEKSNRLYFQVKRIWGADIYIYTLW